jgi:LPS export ABC transporter protein LptC
MVDDIFAKMKHDPRNVRRLLGLILLVAVVVLAAVIVRYFILNSLREKRQALRTAAVEVALKKIHYTEDTESARKWELFAETGEYDKATDKTILNDVRFIVQNAVKGGTVTVTARHGEYAHASKNVILREDVLAVAADGSSFSTPEVLYQANSRVLSGKSHVLLKDGALTVEGIGFDMDLNKGEARVHSNVTATINPAKRK